MNFRIVGGMLRKGQTGVLQIVSVLFSVIVYVSLNLFKVVGKNSLFYFTVVTIPNQY